MTVKRWVVAGAIPLVVLLAFVAGRRTGVATPPAAASRVLYYVDPMHPSYRSDKPGIAPDCGMDLVAVTEEPVPAAKPAPGSVVVAPAARALLGLRVETVGAAPRGRTVRATGRVEVDAGRLHRLMAGAEGWVESVRDNPVGTVVHRDELLATLYSREFRNAQQAYLGSLASLDRVRATHAPEEAGRASDASQRINEEQLRALGMSEAQVRELGRTRRLTSEISVNAPADGVVLARDIAPGQRFDHGTEFYRIADLHRVSITVDVLDARSQAFRPGDRVRVAVRERAVSATATVVGSPPFFDPDTRTLKLRLVADNPGLVLRPGMFVDVELPAHDEPGLTVPADALLDSGRAEWVYVETQPGTFEPRVVTTGWRDGDRVQVTSGLREGERIAASGTFMLDSESRLREHASTAEVVREAIDPRCGMTVDPRDAEAAGNVLERNGATYYFCSASCRRAFEADPARVPVKRAGVSR